MLKFDKKKHNYEFNGRQVLSVTKVLPDIPDFLLCRQSFIEKTLLGSRVHACCDTINQHYIRHAEVPEDSYYLNHTNKKEDIQYINAYIKFLKDNKPVLLFSEMQCYHPLYDYAGTIDLGFIYKKSYIADIKTSTSIAPYARLQLAAYMKMYNYENKSNSIFNRMVIHLLPDGKYILKTFPVKDLTSDFNVFLCKLKSAQWDIENMKGYNY